MNLDHIVYIYNIFFSNEQNIYIDNIIKNIYDEKYHKYSRNYNIVNSRNVAALYYRKKRHQEKMLFRILFDLSDNFFIIFSIYNEIGAYFYERKCKITKKEYQIIYDILNNKSNDNIIKEIDIKFPKELL